MCSHPVKVYKLTQVGFQHRKGEEEGSKETEHKSPALHHCFKLPAFNHHHLQGIKCPLCWNWTICPRKAKPVYRSETDNVQTHFRLSLLVMSHCSLKRFLCGSEHILRKCSTCPTSSNVCSNKGSFNLCFQSPLIWSRFYTLRCTPEASSCLRRGLKTTITCCSLSQMCLCLQSWSRCWS